MDDKILFRAYDQWDHALTIRILPKHNGLIARYMSDSRQRTKVDDEAYEALYKWLMKKKKEYEEMKTGVKEVVKEVEAKVESENLIKGEWDIQKSFDPKESYTVGLFGQTKSGKTTLLKDLITQIQNQYDIILLFSNNEAAPVYDYFKENFQAEFTDKKKKRHKYSKVICFDVFHPEIVKKIHTFNKTHDKYFKFLVLLDDVIDVRNQKELDKLFSIYRNMNISTIASMQWYAYFNKGNRGNMNYIIIGKNGQEGSEKVAEVFLQGFSKEKGKSNKIAEMDKFLKENTKDHNFLVLDILDDFTLYRFKPRLMD